MRLLARHSSLAVTCLILSAAQPSHAETNACVGFGTATHYPVGSNPLAVVAHDFNQDGITDLAVANGTATTFSVLIGQGSGGIGDGSFAAPVHY